MPAPKDDREIRERSMAAASPRRDEELRQHIADRAYRLYLDRGSRPGQDLQDWLEAERQVLAEMRPRPAPEKRITPAASRPIVKSGQGPVAAAKPARRRTLDT